MSDYDVNAEGLRDTHDALAEDWTEFWRSTDIDTVADDTPDDGQRRLLVMNDSPIGHRCYFRGYPHVTGTVVAMYGPESVCVEWDNDISYAERDGIAIDRLTILSDTFPPLSHSDGEPPF